MLLAERAVVAAESPTYPGTLGVFDARGASYVEVRSDADGVRIDDVERVFAEYRPRLFSICPIAENPTGVVLPARRGRAIVELARRYDVVVLEDQTGWTFTYDEPAPPPLAAYDTDGRVVMMESLSKSIFPALRIGYLRVKGAMRDSIEVAKVRTDSFTSTLTQRALWRFMRSPAYPRHLKSARALYRRRRDVFVDALARALPWADVRPPQAGTNVWLRLPPRLSTQAAFEACAREGVLVMPADPFYPTPRRPSGAAAVVRRLGDDALLEAVAPARPRAGGLARAERFSEGANAAARVDPSSRRGRFAGRRPRCPGCRLSAATISYAAPAGNLPAGHVLRGGGPFDAVLPSGRLVTPAGRSVLTGMNALGVALTPDGRFALVSNDDEREGNVHSLTDPNATGGFSLAVVDTATMRSSTATARPARSSGPACWPWPTRSSRTARWCSPPAGRPTPCTPSRSTRRGTSRPTSRPRSRSPAPTTRPSATAATASPVRWCSRPTAAGRTSWTKRAMRSARSTWRPAPSAGAPQRVGFFPFGAALAGNRLLVTTKA